MQLHAFCSKYHVVMPNSCHLMPFFGNFMPPHASFFKKNHVVMRKFMRLHVMPNSCLMLLMSCHFMPPIFSCRLMSCHFMPHFFSCRLMFPFHAISCHIFFHAASCHAISCHLFFMRLHVMPFHVTFFLFFSSCHFMRKFMPDSCENSCHFMRKFMPNSCHAISCGFFSCHVMSCGFFSCHVMSCECWLMRDHVMPIHAKIHAASCHAISCHFFSCHVMRRANIFMSCGFFLMSCHAHP